MNSILTYVKFFLLSFFIFNSGHLFAVNVNPDQLAIDIVKMAHCRVFERLPTQEELDELVPEFKNNGNVRDLMHFLLSSPRHFDVFIMGRPFDFVVAMLFDHALARAATPFEIQKLVPFIQQNGAGPLIDQLLSGAEYNSVWGGKLVPGHGRRGCFTLPWPNH